MIPVDDEKTLTYVTFRTHFDKDDALGKYGRNALAIFALSMYCDVDNRDEFVADASMEGSEDKKIDFCYLDFEQKRLVVAQSYFADKWGKSEAPAFKASGLNTGMSWLLLAETTVIPQSWKAKAMDVRGAIASGDIERIELVVVHNCHESVNIERELLQ